MRGREYFAKLQGGIDFLQRALNFMPLSLVSGVLELFRHTPGLVGFGVRYVCLRRLAKHCGVAVAVYPGVYFLNVNGLEVGDHVTIHQMCYLECVGGLKVGSNVAIAHSTSIITHEHDYSQVQLPIRDAPVQLKPVVIQDNVWIGAGVRILGGVSLEQGAVIGAGAVVTKSVPKHTIVAGIPAKVIGHR
ncbi:MAG: acyltransferase [Anaerolineae bacterium]|nr:acyltransferase [Anaerolineae bacterium]